MDGAITRVPLLWYNQDVIGIDTPRWIVYYIDVGRVESVMRTLTLALAVLLAAYLGAAPVSCPYAVSSDDSQKGFCGCCAGCRAADSDTEAPDTCCDAGVSDAQGALWHTPSRTEGCCACRCGTQQSANVEQSDAQDVSRASMAFYPAIQVDPLVSSAGVMAALSPFPTAMNGPPLFVVHCVFLC